MFCCSGTDKKEILLSESWAVWTCGNTSNSGTVSLGWLWYFKIIGRAHSLFPEFCRFIARQVRLLSGVFGMWMLDFSSLDKKIPSSGNLVDCHSTINAHVSRKRLRRQDLWFLCDTCKGYCGTWVPRSRSVFLVCVSKVSSIPLIQSWRLRNWYL